LLVGASNLFFYSLLIVEVNANMDTPVLGFHVCMKQAMGDNKKRSGMSLCKKTISALC